MTTTKQHTMPDRSRPGTTTIALPIGTNQDVSDKLATGIQQQQQHNINNLNKTMKMPKTITTIGTWNVRTLRRIGKMEELMKELSRYKWDIIGLAETRITGNGELNTEEGHRLYYSGQEKHYEGVGFMIRKELINSVLNYTAVSSRIISIRIKANPINITIIQVYAPTASYSDEYTEKFYENIENTIKHIPKKDFIIIQGDFNAKVGENSHAD